MSCFFCDGNYHVSHNCDVYVSDESRQNRVTMKNCCSKCLKCLDSHDLNLHSEWVDCKHLQKCYICFSNAHQTVYCPNRVEASKIILPSIDVNLLSRYTELLENKEKIALSLNNPMVFKFAKIEPFRTLISVRKINSAFRELKQMAGKYMPYLAENGQSNLGLFQQAAQDIAHLEEQHRQLRRAN